MSDLTNYPCTALMQEIKPFTLFSVKEQSESLLKFNIFIYSDDNTCKPKDLGSSVELELNSVDFVYIHQPFMRIIDYLSYKVIEVFDAQSRVRDINHWSPIYKLSYLLNLPTIQSLQNDEDLMQDTKSFTSIKIFMKNPIITLLPRPGYDEYLKVDLGDIIIKNSPGSETQGNEEIWLDVYEILMKNINIMSLTSDVAERFDLQLSVERPVLSKKQENDEKIDKKYKIKGKCETIKLRFSQEDYRFVLKLMDLNLTYDDQLENYINPESIPYIRSENPDHGGIFFIFFIDFDVLSVLLTHENQEISELLACKTSFNMIKYNDYASEIDFKSLHFVGLMSEEMAGKKEEEKVDKRLERRKTIGIPNIEDPKPENFEISEEIFNIPINSGL